jgi:predicted DNA-binding transcriptional regulator AlpA
MESQNKLLTLKSSAKYTGLSINQFRHAFYNVSNGTAPIPTKIGGRVYWTPTNLEKWISSNTQSE